MLDRRAFLLTGLLAAPALVGRAWAAETAYPLWPSTPPGAGGPSGAPEISARGAITNVARPFITVVRPGKANGAAMLIAAGGGYKRIENAKEAMPAARWLVAQGITAFILTYRLPREGWSEPPVAPLQDAQRALRLIRAMAPSQDIDPDRVGTLGFSAGGHLMGMLATRAAAPLYPQADPADALPARPAVLALAYPIITMEPPYDDTSARRSLIGRHPSARQSREWSVETHVRAPCPATFLAQAADDPIADPAHSAIMADACRKAGVPVERHLFSSGGHGFAMGRPGTPTTQWPEMLADWLARQGFSRG
ncbi:alpha/beta hydrolase [Rhizobium rhizosphaerae]|uniref:Alpha/beta hydrolase n=1 Tax=Xaviernesmea rhizosphaerae TaxID=1672749 RepID=A0ABX3PEI0_9HYPH|nr:alpha/beta hydrolase [Xaviernesmea rhizosphaerae]OQP86496.1 alpha/beta hydrolase [Xaviernesmea rhizosphaerae]